MRIGGVLNLLGKLLLCLALLLLTPLPFSVYYQDGMGFYFLACAGLSLVLGGSLVLLFLPEKEIHRKDGFAIVAFSWLSLALLGSLPYYFSGYIPTFTNAFFESMSGFTTTGSTILIDIEMLPKSLLFWRAMTQWVGGMGIVVFSLAILPLLSVGGTQLFQAKVSGAAQDRLTPRIQDTAVILWAVYLLFTGLETILLMLGGVDFFNALTHAFTTISTGGFSVHNDSVAHYSSVYVQLVFIIFMFVAGANFALHYLALYGGDLRVYYQNEEFRFYGVVIGLAVILVFWSVAASEMTTGTGEQLLAALFQVVAVMTTTGFVTADFSLWSPFCQVLLVSLMFVGGCAGSTGGGIKVVRFLLFFKYAGAQLHKLVHPRQVELVKLGKTPVGQGVMISILSFFAIYLVVFLLASLIITGLGVDTITGPTAVIATLNNIGPGLGLVGPGQEFAHLPAAVKWVLIFCMLVGRLELYIIAVLLTPSYWHLVRKPVFRFSRPVFWRKR